MRKLTVVLVAILGFTAAANANTYNYSGSVVFDSDLNPTADIVLPSFDTNDGILQSVELYFYHSGSADISVDNDDEYQGGTANARLIRTFTADPIPGWGFPLVGTRTQTSAPVDLDPDNGDLTDFDSTPPDGHAFSTLSFLDIGAGAVFPTASAYETVGPGTVAITVNPDTMVNDLQWVTTPDAWQMEVENPYFEVEVQLTYNWIPEPATLSLLAFGGLVVLRRRSR